VVRGVLEKGLPVLVINDGSSDGTSAEIAKLPVTRIEFPVNRGKGRALRRALTWAREHAYTHMITIDADGQHDPDDIPRFIEKINRHPDRIIIGKRDFGTNVPGKSRFGRTWSNLWIRIASGGITPDSQSGYRAYPVQLAELTFLGARYEFEVEVLVRAVWAGFQLDWVDVSVKYFQGTERVSHFKPLWDNMRISVIYTLLVLRRLLPLPHRKHFAKNRTSRVIPRENCVE
jgi:glycosyltransferase involved in cell wall biosynthesis